MTFFTPLLAPTIGEKSLFVRFIAIIPNIKNIKGANLLILQYSINFITKKKNKEHNINACKNHAGANIENGI